MFVGLYLIRFEHKLYTVLLKVDSLFIFCFWFETKFVLFFCLLQFFFFRISALLLNSEMIIKLANISRFAVIFLFRFSVLLLNSGILLKSEIFLGLLQFFYFGFSVSLLNSEMIENSEIFLSLLKFFFLSFPFRFSIPPFCSKS